MQTNPSDSTNTMSVDIRLCGNIPRNEMKERFGAPCSLTALPSLSLTSRHGISTAFSLAETNGSPTLPKTICDAALATGSNLSILHNSTNNENMTRAVLIEKQYAPQQSHAQVLEPPTWAVPARGETRLEVGSLLTFNYVSCCALALAHLALILLIYSTAGLRITGPTNSG